MKTPQVEIDAQGFADGLFLVIRELYIEIFAVVVPGICFFILVIPAIVIPAVDLLGGVMAPNYSSAMFAALQAHPGITFFAILVMSYVIGQMLFRCDPKAADIASIKARPDPEWEGSCVEDRNDECMEFPYASLRDYLERRNFGHLASYVTWRRSDFKSGNEERKHRSKHLINRLKLSIKLYHPRIYFEISRNETHVRLMSSLWYLMKMMTYLAATGLLIGLVVVGLNSEDLTPAVWRGSGGFLHGEAVLYPLATLLLALLLKTKIEKYFHYQRVREIVYVLEAWYLIDPKRRKRSSRPSAAKKLALTDPAPEAAR
ncbi:MAG TPA: hypothetical protein VEA60_04950 [Allosphingosinicella sp.]|nr:hypothetical protein [Allosphingosinicella sp.]